MVKLVPWTKDFGPEKVDMFYISGRPTEGYRIVPVRLFEKSHSLILSVVDSMGRRIKYGNIVIFRSDGRGYRCRRPPEGRKIMEDLDFRLDSKGRVVFGRE